MRKITDCLRETAIPPLQMQDAKAAAFKIVKLVELALQARSMSVDLPWYNLATATKIPVFATSKNDSLDSGADVQNFEAPALP